MDKYIIHWFPNCSGGLCDRILGLASTLCIAKLLNRRVLIKWDHCDLTSGFTINDEHNWYKNKVGYRYLHLNNLEGVDYFRSANIIEDWGNDNVLFWTNVNLYNYSCENTHLLSLHKGDHIQLFSDAIRLIFSTVFAINKTVLDSIEKHKIGIHIRTGDKQIYNKDNEEFYRDYIVNIFTKVRESVTEDDPVFVSSDCLLSYKIAKQYFKHVTSIDGSIIHTSEEDRITEEGLNKVLIDLLTLCNCTDKLYTGWHSNFSRIASLYNPHREFISYEYENDPSVVKECSPDVLFSFFSRGKYT